jgi:hypothetical protein
MNELTTLPHIDVPDLNLPSFIELKNSVLNLEGVPEVAAIILSLRAMGFSHGRIADILSGNGKKIARQTVVDYCNRYDPRGLCSVSKEDKRVLTSQMLQATAIAALMEITQAKLVCSEAKELAAIASRCATAAEKLSMVDSMKDEKKTGRISAMMDALDAGECE